VAREAKRVAHPCVGGLSKLVFWSDKVIFYSFSFASHFSLLLHTQSLSLSFYLLLSRWFLPHSSLCTILMTFTPSSFWTAALGRDFQFTIHAKNKKKNKYINKNKNKNKDSEIRHGYKQHKWEISSLFSWPIKLFLYWKLFKSMKCFFLY